MDPRQGWSVPTETLYDLGTYQSIGWVDEEPWIPDLQDREALEAWLDE